ncbi:AAA family ATPase [Bacillus sp. K2I17]|uniref:AAA family ATPase n=1 Tax=Bacillus sp. K2I17 TaxID=2014743 RepID=UPI00211B0C3D|nr:AAA family ATPase [Bacillus sp. K2I17]
MFGQDNDYITGDKESYRVFKGFIEVLKILLPETLGFNEINIKDGEVILKTDTGDFLIDSVSGGIGAIIDLAWQIYMYDNESPFLVIIDEIENHLHPSMQRNILPNLIKAFPNAQFIVTTHSPFVVNSVINSNVYALKYDDNKRVCSYKLDFHNKSANALEILRDVLGVPVTFPIWIEEKLDVILKKYRDTQLTAKTYTNLKNELNEMGLGEHMPQALDVLQRGNIK